MQALCRSLWAVLIVAALVRPAFAQAQGPSLGSGSPDVIYMLSSPAFGDGDPMAFAMKMIHDPAAASRSMNNGLLAIFGRDDILAAKNFKALIQDMRSRGYEVVFKRSPTTVDFLKALEDPRTVGILHEGHFRVQLAENSPDGKTHSRFSLERPDGTKVSFNESEVAAYEKAVGRPVKPSARLRFIYTSGCYAEQAVGFYNKLLSIPASVRWLVGNGKQSTSTLNDRFARDRQAILENLPARAPAQPSRGAQGHRLLRGAATEATGMGAFAAAFLVKEGFKAVETGDPRHMEASAQAMTRPEFWAGVATFSGVSRATQRVLATQTLQRAMPGAPGNVIRTAVPLAAGMAAADLLAGQASPRRVVVGTSSIVTVSTGMQFLTHRLDATLYPALLGGGTAGRIAAGAYAIAKMAAVLYLGEKLEHTITERIDSVDWAGPADPPRRFGQIRRDRP